MAEIYLGLPPTTHLEQFWQKTCTLPEEGRGEILYAKWKSLASLDDKMRFLLALYHMGWLASFWKTQYLEQEKAPELLEMMAFSCGLLQLSTGTGAELLNKLRHPWARDSWARHVVPEKLDEVLQEQDQYFQKQLEKKRTELLHQMDLSRNLGLKGEQTKFLQILQNVFPQDHTLRQEMQSSEEKQIYETLQRLKKKQSERPSPLPQVSFTEEEKKWLEFIRLQIEQKQDLTLESHILFSYIFLFMEDYESALILLARAPRSLDVDFLKLEALAQLHRYLEVLALVEEMEAQCLSEKELLASLQLFRAKAFYGLDRKEVAIEVLRGLTFHEPGFRESEILLRMWEGELGL